jgi:hypothetical protein
MNGMESGGKADARCARRIRDFLKAWRLGIGRKLIFLQNRMALGAHVLRVVEPWRDRQLPEREPAMRRPLELRLALGFVCTWAVASKIASEMRIPAL